MDLNWTDLFVAIGLVFVLEGIAYAFFPGQIMKMFRLMQDTDQRRLRMIGFLGILLGFFIIWFIRG